MVSIINGLEISENLKLKLKSSCDFFVKLTGTTPKIDIVLIGDDTASKIYVKSKITEAKKIGIFGAVHNFQKNSSKINIVNTIKRIATDKSINGILLQLPIPKEFNTAELQSLIPFEKDVDAFHPINVSNVLQNNKSGFYPCTPLGCMKLIKHALGETLSGKHAVVIGRSQIVGKPIANMLVNENCTVSILHSHSLNDSKNYLLKNADIIVIATGVAKLINEKNIKTGSCVIDVGINESPTQIGKICGDVDFHSAKTKAGFITPVPGGVGPMTIAYLLINTMIAAYRQNNLDCSNIYSLLP